MGSGDFILGFSTPPFHRSSEAASSGSLPFWILARAAESCIDLDVIWMDAKDHLQDMRHEGSLGWFGKTVRCNGCSKSPESRRDIYDFLESLVSSINSFQFVVQARLQPGGKITVRFCGLFAPGAHFCDRVELAVADRPAQIVGGARERDQKTGAGFPQLGKEHAVHIQLLQE